MASHMNAIAEYRPRVVLGKTVQKGELVDLIAGRSGLNKGVISHILDEFNFAILFFCRAGRGVKLEGLGTFTPRTGLSGRLRIGYRSDPSISKIMNLPGNFRGEMANTENIGKTVDDLIEQWNLDNPDDPVQ